MIDLQINEYKFGERPTVTRPNIEFLQFLGEVGIRKMVSRHYDLMRQSPIRKLFPADDAEFENAKLRSSDFMIQILGGQEYYNQNQGQPVLVKRHRSFTISYDGRTVWLSCYRQALLETNAPEHLIVSFWDYINVFSIWMVNSEQIYK
jgi:hemoglobin